LEEADRVYELLSNKCGGDTTINIYYIASRFTQETSDHGKAGICDIFRKYDFVQQRAFCIVPW
jgi:hypothetical protein